MKKKSDWKELVKKASLGIRKRVLEHTINNNGGYLSQSCSSAEILSVLYLKIMNLGKVEKPIIPGEFKGVPSALNTEYRTGAYFNGKSSPELDRFFLSPSQYALPLYAALIESGRMSEDGLKHFNKDGSIVEMIGAEHSPGMEVMNGSLGQTISQAAGIAFAKKKKDESGRIFIFLSDGELQIGQTWEAVQSMAFHKLDNISIFIDMNGYQCDGAVNTVTTIEPAIARFKSFGCQAYKVNGHDIDELAEKGTIIKKDKPVVILAYTNPWQGINILKTRHPKFHYVRFSGEEEKNKYIDFFKKMGGS